MIRRLILKDHISSVIITGASGGIGQALARRFAWEGYRLFLHACRHMDLLQQQAQDLILKYGVPVFTLQADLSHYADLHQMFQTILQEDPAPDCLINNAGISFFSLLQDAQEADWDRVMNTNAKSVFGCCKEVLPSMLRRHEGSIINISSMWGCVGASMETLYSASKGAVNAFTRALGKEVAPSGIRVNAIACGVIDTPMNDVLNPEEKQSLAQDIPLGRFALPIEVADLAWYLAGSQSSYLTAQVISLDGGYL